MTKIASVLLQRIFADSDPELEGAFTGWNSGGWVFTAGVVEHVGETPLSLALKAGQELRRVADEREKAIESQVDRLAAVYKATSPDRIREEAAQWGSTREVVLGNGSTDVEWTFSEARLGRLIESLLSVEKPGTNQPE